jgi:3-(3-hydroxy-phenyl)propionate hydroxylase
MGDKPFKLDWMSVYKFRCAKLDRFVHNRMIFVGDSAHVVSPFGARGGNGGIQDVDNLCWKLAAVLKKEANESLLETYNEERVHGSAENILNSSRATNFMTPKSPIEHLFRNEVLNLSKRIPFARKLINSGRLSIPCSLAGMILQGEDHGDGHKSVSVGDALIDAPISDASNQTWLVSQLQGEYILLGLGNVDLPKVKGVTRIGINQGNVNYKNYLDLEGFAMRRYGEGNAYLIRPDGHIAAIFSSPTVNDINHVLDRTANPYQTKDVA